VEVSYDVRIWSIEVYNGKRGNSYYVRWVVAGRPRRRPFKRNKALAEGFRSDLISAARKGEAFDVETGLPVSMRRAVSDVPWYTLACEYVDLKWPLVAATTRRTHAEALTTVTTALFTTDRGKPGDKLIRKALCRWAFNTSRRNDPNCPTDVRRALRWIETHTKPVSALRKPGVLRPVLDHLTVKLDGTPAAPSVVNRKKKIFSTVLEYAVERELLDSNPIPALRWKPPTTARSKAVQPVDRRRVAGPLQVRTLLQAVRERPRSGPRLVAFYACLYFAAMRPEEAVALAKHHLALPAEGWGEFHLSTAEPYAGAEWTDSGRSRDRRQLKQRPVGETRLVPCCPELTAIIHAHIARFGFGPDGRLFVGERNSRELPKLTIVRAWKRAREAVFTPEVIASPLAATPYDLRHAAVSGWLNAGVPVPEVAEWAGHSPEVLLRIYAKCIDGGAVTYRRRIEWFLGQGQRG
jgi:integrase